MEKWEGREVARPGDWKGRPAWGPEDVGLELYIARSRLTVECNGTGVSKLGVKGNGLTSILKSKVSRIVISGENGYRNFGFGGIGQPIITNHQLIGYETPIDITVLSN